MSRILLDPALHALAVTQSGMFTTRQAAELGTDDQCLLRLVRAAAITHVTRGLYSLPPHKGCDAEDWHRRLCVGSRLLYPDAVLAGASAVLAHNLPVWGCNLAKPIIRRSVSRGRATKGIVLRRPSGSQVATDWGPAVPVATALVELAIDHGACSGVVSMNAALHLGKVTRDELEEQLATMGDWPRVSRAKSAFRLSDERPESVAESRTLYLLAIRNIATTPQFRIRTPSGQVVARVDFLIDGTTVVLEVDGKVKYTGTDDVDAAKTLWQEKIREDKIRALKYTVARVYWSDLEKPERLVAKVRQALARSIA